jgi:hypothetical protein
MAIMAILTVLLWDKLKEAVRLAVGGLIVILEHAYEFITHRK